MQISIKTFSCFPVAILLLLCSFATTVTCIITEKANLFTTDNIGNLYLVQGDAIRKFDSHCNLQKEFSNKNFGAITSADATNPLRLVIFYRDFNRIIFLDNTLSQNGDPVQLEQLGFPMATVAASSHDNGIWIYDQQNFELVRLNQKLQIDQRTGNLSQVLGIDSLQPDFMLEKDNRLFLNNPKTGVLVFDIFGTYSKTIPVKGLKNFQIADDYLVYFTESNLKFYDIITTETGVYEEPSDSLAINMRIEKEAVYVLKNERMELHKR
jgi:hypothetical protein